ncbi:hypothetical protein ABE65_014070 [Fictibacillus phosphorivorans]|uniref:DUF92 domain-containing protein n=1 Tax=Fictibacillus phosphorivorans TaxID=1221500 RepID=A0A160INE2_9BACL|nr:DUF92 domain-containing protein [Fictibacillus phosphorivorans]ANC77863.1 hypothetical protein ABE65_014070 [Fictibacillus phosphorivorans]
MIIMIVGIALLSITSALLQWLTVAGSVTAFIMGVIIYKAFGWQGLILLGLFFITSTLLTKWKKDKKQDQDAIHTEDQKGRTAGQVLANGGAALLAAVGHLTITDPVWIIVFAATFATATADTWASEIGVLSKKRPFHIKEWRRVDPGLSGAISSLGTVAAALGATFIGYCFYILYDSSIALGLCIVFSGFLGNIADTFFGAWFEQKYVCSICKRETESHVHCGVKAVKVFGNRFFTNNVVNFLSTIIGGLIAGGLSLWIKSW